MLKQYPIAAHGCTLPWGGIINTIPIISQPLSQIYIYIYIHTIIYTHIYIYYIHTHTSFVHQYSLALFSWIWNPICPDLVEAKSLLGLLFGPMGSHRILVDFLLKSIIKGGSSRAGLRWKLHPQTLRGHPPRAAAVGKWFLGIKSKG